MLFRAVRTNCAANTRAPQTSMPIQSSHTASLIHARKESGGSVSGWRFQGLISGDIHRAISISRPSHLALAGCGGFLFLSFYFFLPLFCLLSCRGSDGFGGMFL